MGRSGVGLNHVVSELRKFADLAPLLQHEAINASRRDALAAVSCGFVDLCRGLPRTLASEFKLDDPNARPATRPPMFLRVEPDPVTFSLAASIPQLFRQLGFRICILQRIQAVFQRTQAIQNLSELFPVFFASALANRLATSRAPTQVADSGVNQSGRSAPAAPFAAPHIASRRSIIVSANTASPARISLDLWCRDSAKRSSRGRSL